MSEVVSLNNEYIMICLSEPEYEAIVYLTIHYRVSIDSSCSHSIHSPHCNIVGYSWFTRHCVATNRRAQLCLYHCAVITGIIGHNIVKDWEIFYQWWRLK